MSSVDYSLFAKERLRLDQIQNEHYDVFLSSFNDSERVNTLYGLVDAASKIWLVHPEYEYAKDGLPTSGNVFHSPADLSAIEFWQTFFDWLVVPDKLENLRVAVDITGMMRPHLMLLPLMLKIYGIDRATFFYSDPMTYSSGDRTKFSKGPVEGVALIPGMEGAHGSGTDTRDVLIIGAGYDHQLVIAAAEDKRSADHYLLMGLPSLQPHMYQESILRLSKASESIRDYRSRTMLFAPANDPFMTAQVLSDHISRLKLEGKADNIYLSPVGAKTQVLGFSWYFLCEARHTSTSMMFPHNKYYERETSRGISSIHKFIMELDMIID
ncbi:hypothetical protein [Pseudarthrobacter sulfonivorans]|uniref:hypothetical protein n=1 Tax=Pseudarthrobacter sulfonivorans TaxID=121292 RepID=UPI00285B5933|nr:hypothetical protein [Pseudarthrobacter sulfonivorans]MDR6417725.1 hypothetical protein [Pseudarthrobacter sulfonivorans]